MNIEDLTIKEAREIAVIFNNVSSSGTKEQSQIDAVLIGKYHIFRTYSAGVFFGKLKYKEANECIIDECRRLWYWKTKTGVC